MNMRTVAHSIFYRLWQIGNYLVFLSKVLRYHFLGNVIVVECLHDLSVLENNFKLPKSAFLVDCLSLNPTSMQFLVNFVKIVDIVD